MLDTNKTEKHHLRIVMAQFNPLVGDIEGNVQRIKEATIQAGKMHSAELVIFPELAITGYPPEDLLLRSELYFRVDAALTDLRKTLTTDILVGHPLKTQHGIFNAASFISNGQISHTYRKQILPNYSVFDEKRYFIAGVDPCIVNIKSGRFAITICEDIWETLPSRQALDAGAQCILNLNASPFHCDKRQQRERIIRQRVAETGLPIVYVNMVGGQDELVFDGASFVMNGHGQITQQAPGFEEALIPVDIKADNNSWQPINGLSCPKQTDVAIIYWALVLGVRDYIKKNRFTGAVLGLSGGIDSALTLAIAADAIGPDHIEAIMMPSRYTQSISLEDAQKEADLLGVQYHEIKIEPAFQAFTNVLQDCFSNYSPDVTEENIQARCRGTILMAISNKKRKILLTTGNKSELAVGYATLYGDMAGGFAPIRDVPKTLVYRLAHYRNTISAVIPERVLTRPPSAELAPDQKDQDSLPPYDILDPILQMYIEQGLCSTNIIKQGFDKTVVDSVISMVDRNEYKRRQAPPGVRITKMAFGRDRRYPITSGFKKTRNN